MHLNGKIDNLRTMLRKRDFLRILIRGTSRLMPFKHHLFFWNRFVILGLRGPLRVVPRAGGAPVEMAVAADIERICERHPDRAVQLRRRWSQGQTCLVIREDGEVVASAWMITGVDRLVTNSGMPFHLDSNGAWCLGMYIDPECRLRGYFVKLIAHLRGIAEERARPCLYGETDILNDASIQAHLRIGFEVVQTVTFFSIFGFKVFHIQDQAGRRRFACTHAFRPEPL